MAARLKALSEGAADDAARVAALLGVREVFPATLAARLARPVTAAYGRLVARGARGAMAEFVGDA
jgi:fructuronate reductase